MGKNEKKNIYFVVAYPVACKLHLKLKTPKERCVIKQAEASHTWGIRGENPRGRESKTIARNRNICITRHDLGVIFHMLFVSDHMLHFRTGTKMIAFLKGKNRIFPKF